MSDRIALRIENITFGYDGQSPVLQDLNFEVRTGETIALVGPNGAGKSTLMKLMVGLNFPNCGEIRIGDVVVDKLTLKSIREKIGFAFQDSESQLFMTTVYEDIAFGPAQRGLDEEEVARIVNESLEAVKGRHLADRPPHKLSGGEKKTAALATVLSMEPEIIILDEPTNGLDPKSRRNLMGLMKSLPQTKIIATHDLDMALEICDRVAILNNGKVQRIGLPKDIFSDLEMLEASQLEQPFQMQGCHACAGLARV